MSELVRTGNQGVVAAVHVRLPLGAGTKGDSEALARELSDRFASGAVTSLTRRLPDGRHLRADARPLDGGRLVVTYQEVQPADRR